MKEEQLLEAWVGLTGILKNSRLTDELSYNESIIMMLSYKQYKEKGTGEVPVQTILEETRMLKSLANRTINGLEKKGLMIKKKDERDSRKLCIYLTEKGMEAFLKVHQQSLNLAHQVMELIGEEDTDGIISAYAKMRSCFGKEQKEKRS